MRFTLRLYLFLVSASSWSATLYSLAATQAGALPPGVPEPGIVIWGTVVNQTNSSQAIEITSATWSVSDGTKTAVYSDRSRPATRIVNVDGQSYYVLQVPFDTRQIGTVTLADPATVGINSFELASTTAPTYILGATINGALATVRSIDGAPATGTNVPVAGFTAVTRGRVIRVDLAITPGLGSYDTWASSIFGNPNLPEAARTADPDGDGLTNEGEFSAGTDPKDANSALRILELAVGGQSTPTTLGWKSTANRSYFIETAVDPQGPWTALGSPLPSGGATTRAGIAFSGQEPNRFYRVRLAP